MKLRTKLLSIFMVFAMVITFFTPIQAKAEETNGFKLEDVAGKTVILHTNDTHGRVQRGTDKSLGITTVAALKKVIEEAGGQVILLDAGDTFHGKPIATIDSGFTIATLMNACGYDAMTLGNHDYNYGSKRVLKLAKMLDFPVLASNVINKEDGTPFVSSDIIIEKNGIKYGIFGLSTQETVTKTNPNNVIGLTFNDLVETSKKEVEYLKEQGADVVVALGHVGIDASSDPTSADILNQVDGIDLFVDGHSHSSNDSCKAVNKSGALLVSNGQYLNTIGCVVVDKDKNMTSYTITGDILKACGVKTELAEGETEVDVNRSVGVILTEAEKSLSASLNEVVGTADVYLDGVRENVRTKETNLGNLAADAIRWAANADIAMTNGGGIRTDIKEGEITKGMLAEVFPFGNIVVSKKVTGAAIKEMLEHGVKDYPATSGGYPQVSGMTFTMDPNKEEGSRISNIKIGGKAIDEKAYYVLASNDFTIAGGDGYTMIGDEIFPKLCEYGALDEVLIKYIETKPAPESYAVGRTKVIAIGETAEAEEVEETEEVAATVEETKTEPVTYHVVKGDCLSTIAKKLLGKASDWKLIFEWNKDQIKNPDMIYIGQDLVILGE